MSQREYLKVDLLQFSTAKGEYPKDKQDCITADLDMIDRDALTNITEGVEDEFAGTLSPATLQCILEYTTIPSGIVLSFNAQFGAIYSAAENCGRMAFGAEGWPHFGEHALNKVKELVPGFTGEAKTKGNKKRKMVPVDSSPDAPPPPPPPKEVPAKVQKNVQKNVQKAQKTVDNSKELAGESTLKSSGCAN